ncbi:MAG: cytochrome C family protein [Nitrospirae bacterium]|nr:MAG: cytochrome C family protein [Nitrospirota bacterium]
MAYKIMRHIYKKSSRFTGKMGSVPIFAIFIFACAVLIMGPAVGQADAVCTRVNPTVSIFPSVQNVLAGNAVTYTVSVINNDSGDTCGSTTFTLSKTDAPVTPNANFTAALSPLSITLNVGASGKVTLTHTAAAGASIGATQQSYVTSAADANHAAVNSSTVTTTVIATSGDGYLLKRGKEETCHGCHKTNKNMPSPGETGYVQANWDNAIKTHSAEILGTCSNTTYKTRTACSANGGTWTPGKWNASGGWGIAGGRYGEFVCTTCHTGHSTTNIYLIKETITTPDGSNFGGSVTSSVTVNFRVKSGTPAVPGPQTAGIMGDDSVTHAASAFICEVCHTFDGAQTTGVNKHAYTMTSITSHYNGQECNTCHSHSGGFKASCNSCHGNPPISAVIGGPSGLATPATGATSPLSPGAHNTHVTTRGMTCNVCHTGNTMPTVSNTIQMGFVTNSTTYPTVWSSSTSATTGAFDGHTPLNAPYTGFVSSSIGTNVTTSGSYANTCSTLYCHGSTLTAGTLTSPSWVGGSSQAACGTCHGGAGYTVAATTPPTTGKHITHAATTTGNLGLACNKCHNSPSPSMTHVNGVVSWSLDTADSRIGASATYNGAASGGSTTQLAPTPYESCATLYCHSNGKVGTSVGAYTTPVWDGADIGCNGCHGTLNTAGTPDYANEGAGTVGANSHSKHTVAGTSTCVYCHTNTTTTGTTITGTVHIDNTRNVLEGGGKSFTYTPQTCTNISCHGGFGTAATWGGAALTCTSCHGRTTAGGGDLDDFAAGGNMAKVDTDEWAALGHGRPNASGNYPGTNPNPPANFAGLAGSGQDPCLWCHDGISADHGNYTTNPYRLRNNNALGNGWNDACLYCHDTNQTTASYKAVATFTTGINLANVKKIDKWHYGSNHSATRNGGQFCWDCHDPHGDGTTGPIKMIQKYPTKTNTNATYGVPSGANDIDEAVAIVFTNNNLATGANGFAMTAGTFRQGICNACHTYSASAPTVTYYTSTSSTSHNSGTVCTQCHKHSADTTNNNEAFKGGGCNGCHDYDTRVGFNWGDGFSNISAVGEGKGAHKKHIDHLKARYPSVTLNPNTDTFNGTAPAAICGTCHTIQVGDHSTNGGAGTVRSINFGNATYKEGGSTGFSFLFDPSAPGTNPPVYNGASGTSSSVNPKSCSVVGCHFTKSPVWQAY